MIVPTKGGTPKPPQMVLYWHSRYQFETPRDRCTVPCINPGTGLVRRILKTKIAFNPGAYIQLILGFFHINETGTKSSKYPKCCPNDIELVRRYPYMMSLPVIMNANRLD